MNKNISIITNFGCTRNCNYCVWKNHSLKDCKEKTNWSELESFLYTFKENKKVSISGGGDPLYFFEIDKELRGSLWYNKLFSITDRLKMLVDIHTRVEYYNHIFWKKVNRISFSIINLNSSITFIQWVKNYTKVRLVYVVESHTTDEYVQELINFCEENNIQLTFKQLYGQDDNGRYEQLKSKYKNIFFLDYNDYNLYYMPNNSVYDKFVI